MIGEMSLQFKAPIALADDLSWVPRTPKIVYNDL